METEEVRREQSWYIRDLMAYMLGIPGEDLERLVESYQEDGGAPDPGGLFRYLSARGKKYQILWAAVPFSDAISVLFAAVMGPNKALLWQGSSVVPFGLDSGSLRIWNRVLEMVSGVAIPTNPQVSETDLWSAEQIHRGLREPLQNPFLGPLLRATGEMHPHVGPAGVCLSPWGAFPRDQGPLLPLRPIRRPASPGR